MKKNSVAVIGGGPGGYATAIRLHQYGIDTIIFEKERLGGVCLNWGCIPTKTLVKSADMFTEIKKAAEFGINVNNAEVDYNKVYERKNGVVEQLVSGIEFLFKKRKIPVINEIVNVVEKTENGFKITTGSEQYAVDYVIVATGSKPKELPFLKFNGNTVLSSKDILKMQEIPKRLGIIGGGVIGCEFASIFHQFGSEVEIIEMLPDLVIAEDRDVSKRLAIALKKSGIKLHLKSGVESAEVLENSVKLTMNKGKELEFDKVLVSIGRAPVSNIQFKNCNIELNQDGSIKINESMETNETGIYAIGDVTAKMMLAHTATKQGLIAAEILKNKIAGTDHDPHALNYMNIPRCTFTHPEIGSCGLTQMQAKEEYGEITVSKFPFTANGKALGMGNTFGFVKFIARNSDNLLVGAHIIGPNATELIAEAAILIQTGAKIETAHDLVFAHPTLSETVGEAIEDLENLAIHKA